MDKNDFLLKIVILDHNVFITDVIEEILQDYSYELIKIKSLENFNEACDFLIFYEESLSEDLINRISSFANKVNFKILICSSERRIPVGLIPYLSSVIQIGEIDEQLKYLLNHYTFFRRERTFQEDVEMINKLIKESEEYIHSILEYTNYLKTSLKNIPEDKMNLLVQFESIVNIFKNEFISFEHFNFADKVFYQLCDLNSIIEDLIREREKFLLLEFKKLTFIPDYLLDQIFLNPVVVRKLINNIINLIEITTKNPKELFVSIKKNEGFTEIRIEIQCEDYNSQLKNQIYSPFFPRRILENTIIDYFRNKIEKYHRIFIKDFYKNNKLVFQIFLE